MRHSVVAGVKGWEWCRSEGVDIRPLQRWHSRRFHPRWWVAPWIWRILQPTPQERPDLPSIYPCIHHQQCKQSRLYNYYMLFPIIYVLVINVHVNWCHYGHMELSCCCSYRNTTPPRSRRVCLPHGPWGWVGPVLEGTEQTCCGSWAQSVPPSSSSFSSPSSSSLLGTGKVYPFVCLSFPSSLSLFLCYPCCKILCPSSTVLTLAIAN